ncbi:MAG: ribonuclease H-like domain-containing protein [Chloroflexi bacterium]|nr:ribonuclease H-like domain-containing protein [Chloroflexota bacterium]
MATPTLDRLRHAIKAHLAAQPGARARAPALHTGQGELPPIEQILRGEWHETAYGPVFVRDDWFALDHAHGAHALGSALAADPAALAHLLRAETAPHPERYAFFDIETTGLSGGTGTYVVLAGLGTFERPLAGEPPAFRLRQYFLAGLQHERAMLAMLAEDLARFEAVVTYNGRAFDVPVMESRLTLARLASPYRGMAHFDLLHPVRRLYAHRMPGCRLAEAERRLLRIDRPDDVPGSLIPALYRDYLMAGRAGPLRGVFRHNAEDVLSLVGVLSSLAGLLSRDDHDPDDAIAVARWWERAGESQRAMRLYGAALPWLEGGDDWAWAASRHAGLCKRHGPRAEAVEIWRRLWASGDRAAGLELAKYLEHRAKELEEAAGVVELLLRGARATETVDLSRRLARILRRLERRAGRTRGRRFAITPGSARTGDRRARRNAAGGERDAGTAGTPDGCVAEARRGQRVCADAGGDAGNAAVVAPADLAGRWRARAGERVGRERHRAG